MESNGVSEGKYKTTSLNFDAMYERALKEYRACCTKLEEANAKINRMAPVV